MVQLVGYTMKKKTTDNPDSFLGYAKQVYRGLFYLLKKQTSVFIEKNDDILVSDEYGYLVLEQVKDKNTKKIMATSPDFLDTILHWADLYEHNKEKFNDRTKCVLALLLKNEIDELILSCEMAKTKSECEEIYLKILTKLKTLKQRSYYLDFEKHKTALLKIIKIFETTAPIISARDDCENEIKNFLEDKIEKARIKNYSEQILGWFFKAAVNDENKQLRLINITFDDFISKCLRLNGENIQVNYPEPYQLEKSFDDYSKIFVKQLKLLNLDKELIDDAVLAFWSWDYLLNNDFKDGRVTMPEINRMYSNLCARWRSNKMEISCQCLGVEMGKRLYRQSLREKVQISGVSIYGDEESISRGVHNYLANDIEKYNIGWHPDFKVLLNAK